MNCRKKNLKERTVDVNLEYTRLTPIKIPDDGDLVPSGFRAVKRIKTLNKQITNTSS